MSKSIASIANEQSTDSQLSLAASVGRPIVAENPDAVGWHDIADVVVVGFGGAGVCAAIEAAELGAKVIALDRFEGGGATALSGGVYYAGDTSFQKAAGFQDSADNLFRYLSLEVSDAVSSTTLRHFCDTNNHNLEWLVHHGVQFDSALDLDKTGYPRRGTYLYFSGNERLAGYKEHAEPMPRGHRAFHASRSNAMSGGHFFAPLHAAAIAAGVRLISHAPVTRLVVDSAGDVVGVEATVMGERGGALAKHRAFHDGFKPMNPFKVRAGELTMAACHSYELEAGERRLIRARAGVILSTGGFVNNARMLATYAPQYLGAVRQGSMGCDGSGIGLGVSVGGVVSRMERVNVSSSIAPNAALRGVLVNQHGKRFINEEAYTGTLGYYLGEEQSGRAWLILDRSLMMQVLGQCLPSRHGTPFVWFKLPIIVNLLIGGTRMSATIEGLARKLGVPANELQRTIADYNLAAGGEREDEFQKNRDYLQPLERGPFFAINRCISNPLARAMAFTLGGLALDEETGGVLRSDGHAIAGLFAAGRTAVGLPSHFYVSGMSIADCVFSGRRAGRAALQNLI